MSPRKSLGMNRAQLPSGIATGIGSLPHRDAAAAAAVRPDHARAAGDPDAAEAFACRGNDPPGARRTRRNHRRPIRKHRLRCDQLRPRRSCRDRSPARRVRRLAGVPRRCSRPQGAGEMAVRRSGHARSRAGSCRAHQRRGVRGFGTRCSLPRSPTGRPRRHCPARLPPGGVHRRANARRADGRQASRSPPTPRSISSPQPSPRSSRSRSTGLHVCATADIASLVSIGPDVLSVPVDMRLLESAGYLARFLERRRHDRVGRSVDRRPDRHVGRTAVAQAQRAVVRARATRRRPRTAASAIDHHAGVRSRHAHACRGRARAPPCWPTSASVSSDQATATRFSLGA